MKRFSKVVRHPHKLTQWSAGIKKKTDYKKRTKKELFCEESRIVLDRISKEQNVSSARSLCVAWSELKKSQTNTETLMNILEVLLNSCVNPCECVSSAAVLHGDIRALLCDKRLTCKLLMKLLDYWDRAIVMMEIPTSLRASLRELKPEKRGGVSVELLRLFGWTSALGEEEISSYHLSVLMPWLSAHDNLTARIFCDKFDRLSDRLHGQVLFAVSHPDSLHSWVDVFLTLSNQRSDHLLRMLIKKDVDKHRVIDDIAPMISFLFYQVEKANLEDRLSQFVTLLLKGMSAARLNCLLELERHIEKKGKGSWYRVDGVDDFSAIEPLLKYVNDDKALELWSSEYSSEVWRKIRWYMESHELDVTESENYLGSMIKQAGYLTC